MTKLWGALDKLRGKGAAGHRWVKGHFRTRNGWYEESYCMLGSLGFTGFSQAQYDRDVDTIAEVIREQFPERVMTTDSAHLVAHFNDMDSTTWTDVEKVMEKAAIKRDEVLGA
jgi:hypothetical protein